MYQSKRSPLMIFISLALVILTACGPVAPTAAPEGPQATEAPATAEATEAPAATEAPISVENTLVIDSNIDDLITLDPAVVYEYSGILIAHNVYQTLVTFVGADMQTIKPGLAGRIGTGLAGVSGSSDTNSRIRSIHSSSFFTR